MSKEYIEREALFEKLHEVGGCDADTGTWAAGYDAAIDLVIAILEKEPAADVVEVVRCEKCKFGKYDEQENKVLCIRMKNIGDGELYVYNELNDYCSYGERKDGTDNAAD